MIRWFLNEATEMAIIFVLFLFFVGLSGLVYYRFPGPLVETKTVVIEAGTGAGQIADKLIDAGVIRGPKFFFLAVLSLSDQRGLLKAGEYSFYPHERMISVVRKLVVGQVIVHRFTLVEGETTYQVLQNLKNTSDLVGDVPSEVPEGSLFPDTYFYNRGDTRVSLLKRMNDAMRDNLQKVWEKRKLPLPKQVNTPRDIVILASMIEKETGIDSEREKVAGVFVNRLNDGMRLQSDPTVVYALTQGRGRLGRRLTLNDLQNTKSPYNTYVTDGLPAGPICNPGIKSLEAAAYPEENSYFYFVADGYGGHKFSSSLAEHNRNVIEWRRVQRLLNKNDDESSERAQ